MRTQIKTNEIGNRMLRFSKSDQSRHCNLCARKFAPRTVFDRYCSNCKDESELLKFSEWLPEIGDDVQEKISA